MNGTGKGICALMIMPVTAFFACRTRTVVDAARLIWRAPYLDRHISSGIAS